MFWSPKSNDAHTRTAALLFRLSSPRLVSTSQAENTADDWRPSGVARLASTLFGSVGLAAVGLATAALIGRGTSAGAVAPAAAAAPASATREITLEAKEVDWELYPGTTVRAWTFNGTVPGPEIRVAEGDLVRITLKNSLPVPTAAHWHGIDVPNAMDGVPGLTQDAVPPGGTFTYEFVATNPGTRWYHSHQDAEVQGPLGMYGPFIVEPRSPASEPKYDREYTYVLSEWALALTPEVATGQASLPRSGPGAPHAKQLDYDLFLMNGHAHESIEPLQLKAGERVRVRLINAGNLVHTIHTHGHSFKIVATDGNPVPSAAQLTKDSITIGPSERYDLELVASNPGVWMFHCHMEHHMANGMMTTIRYEGAEPPVGAPTTVMHTSAGAQGSGATANSPAADPHAAHNAAPATTAKVSQPASPATVGATVNVPASAQKIVMTDNRYQPGTITISAGTTVAWINNGANVHTVSALDGSFESGSIAPDSAYTFTFKQPGTYQFICRQHLLNGMRGTIVVQ